MNMNDFIIGAIAIFSTVVVYLVTRWFNKKLPHPFTLPILLSTILLAVGLLILRIPYETYYIGGQWIEKLLGPAVVALAYPLYLQRKMIKRFTIPIIVGVSIGSFVGVISGLAIGKLLNLDLEVILSILPKSVTTPVAMDIAKTVGGSPPLTAIFVMVAGISGAVMGHTLFRWFGINHSVTKGLAMGSASHAIGTARSLQESQQEAAASTIAMTLSAVIVSILTPLLT